MNLPQYHRESDSTKVVEAMYLELMRRFDYGDKFIGLHPVDEMEIVFDEEQDSADIKELVEKQEEIKELLGGQNLSSVKEAAEIDF